jgi:hypothetical protein
MSDVRVYQGGCHCGAVRFEVELPALEKTFACSCSMCSRMGWRLAFTPSEAFTLLSSESMKDYQFHNKTIHHHFCGVCGVRSFSLGPGHDGKPWATVNVRCVEGVDVEALPVEWFDGASL